MNELIELLLTLDGWDASNDDDCDDIDVGRTECIADCKDHIAIECHMYRSSKSKTINYLL